MVARRDPVNLPMPPKSMHDDLVVLTGDIVGSSRLGPERLDAAMGALERAAAEDLSHWGAGETRFTRFRGDGWQCLGPPGGYWLRGLLLLRARLRALGREFDTRVSVGIGAGRLAAGPGLADAGGAAFEISGRGLETMGHARRFAMARAGPPALPAEAADAILALSDEVSRRWTPRQAEVFAVRLLSDDAGQATLASVLGMTQQAVAKHLSAGGNLALSRALAAFEAVA